MTARIILALVMLAVAGTYLTWRLIGTGKGQHAAPRGWAEDSERLATTAERVIEPAIVPRAPTEHAPPWMPAPPVTEPEPEAYFIASGPVIAGQPVLTHYTELLPPVAELLGYPSVGAAMDALCAGLHSWESNFTKGDTRLVRALTDGAS